MGISIKLSNLLVAMVIGIALGVSLPLAAHYLGLSTQLAGPIAGGLTGTLVPFIYRWHESRNEGSDLNS